MLLSIGIQLLLAAATAAPLDQSHEAISDRAKRPYYGPIFGFCGLPGTACYTRVQKEKEHKNAAAVSDTTNDDPAKQEIPFAPTTLETFSVGSTTVTGGPPVTSTDSVKADATATATERCTTSSTLTTLTFHTGEALPPGGGLP